MSSLFVAWRANEAKDGWGPVGRLEFDSGIYRFCYTRGARSLPQFKPFPQMENIEQVYESEQLFPLFANRLLSKSRPEYDAYLRWGGFDPVIPPDPIAILGVTEGIRQTDSVEVFPCPVPDANGCYLNRFFMHGVRWLPQYAVDRISRLVSGEQLYLMYDGCNNSDPRAAALRTEEERTLIGYVPRYLAHDVWQIFSQCARENISVTVERLNRDAPLQQRVLCRMNSCWPAGFQPCSGEEFQPIPANIPARCGAQEVEGI
jgi:hypothetical protein